MRAHFILGTAVSVAALAAIFIWIPLDTGTGLIEKVRRQVTIGDALAPTVGASFVLLGGLMLCLFERKATDQPSLTQANFRFVLVILGITFVALMLMRWLGPAGFAIAGTEGGYRPFRASAPWKYIGFIVGGAVLITSTIAWVEARLSARAILVGVIGATLLALVYDLPFDDLLLPPNGDV